MKKDKRQQYEELAAMRPHVRDALMEHIKSFSFPDLTSYKAWCRDNGFTTNLAAKNRTHFAKEKAYVVGLSAARTLYDHKQSTKSFSTIAEQILTFKVDRKDVEGSSLYTRLFEVRDLLKDPSSRLALLSLLKLAERKSKFFNELTKGKVIAKLGAERSNSYLEALITIVSRRADWINQPETWKIKSHNPHRQFLSLITHLFCKYPVPEFMYSAWFATLETHRNWFLHLTKGGNIRKAPHLNVQFNKTQAHTFLQAPKHYGISDAIKWAQVIGIGGDHRLAETVNRSKAGHGNHISEFWMSYVQWLINNPMLDPVHIGPISDYISNQKFEDQITHPRPGVIERLPPAQPNFSMKFRTAEALLRQVQEWHGALRKVQGTSHTSWEKSPIEGLDVTEGTIEKKNMRRWIIEELTDSKSLAAEGRDLKHCVSSYAGSCSKGVCTIWSLKLDGPEGVERKLTVEVSTQRKAIVQIRGKMNRLAEPVETRIIEKWAQTTGLSIDAGRRRW